MSSINVFYVQCMQQYLFIVVWKRERIGEPLNNIVNVW
jgi:hypothetical protein